MPLLPLSDEDYRRYAQNQPELPLWQSLAWKAYQEALGRETRLYGLISNAKMRKCENTKIPDAAALIIIDRTAFGLSTWDIPRGPTGNPEYFGELLSGIIDEAKQERCMAVYFSPEVSGVRCQGPETYNLTPSRRHEQPLATVIIDLTKSDEEILKNMHEKGRYNIRLAQRHGVGIEESKDIDAFYALLKKTGERDRYGIKPKSHYEKFLTLPGSFLILAFDLESLCNPPFDTPDRVTPEPACRQAGSPSQSEGVSKHKHGRATQGDTFCRASLGTQKKTLAGLLGVISGETGIYYYGASDHAGRAKMAPSLLQFEAMKFCRARGARRYDLFGIAPNDDPAHPWAGVTRFKKQFGGIVALYPHEQEMTLMPIMKRLIEWKRKIH